MGEVQVQRQKQQIVACPNTNRKIPKKKQKIKEKETQKAAL